MTGHILQQYIVQISVHENASHDMIMKNKQEDVQIQ